MVEQGFNDRVRYTLSCVGYDSFETNQITGWKEDDKEFARNETYDGIFVKLSNSLKFYGEAREWLAMIYAIEGVIAKVGLLKEERHPKTDLWVFSYDSSLDMNEYENENGIVSVKANSGGLEELVKSRESEEIELDRLTTMDGATIDPLQTQTVALDGRKIFLQSKWKTDPSQNQVFPAVLSPGLHVRSVGVPLELTQKSHEEAQSVSYQTYWDDGSGEVGGFCIAESLEDRQFRCYGKIKFKINGVFKSVSTTSILNVNITVYGEPPLYNSLFSVPIFTIPVTNGIISQSFEVDFDEVVVILKKMSIAIEFDLAAAVSIAGTARVSIGNIDCDLNLDEDSFFDKTSSKFLLTYDAFERIVEITTGKKENLVSNFFGRPDKGYSKFGNGALTGILHGFWARGFDKEPPSTQFNQNPFKPLTTSLREQLESFAVTHNIGMGIEKVGYQERIRIEDKKYFYNRNVITRLPNQIKNVKRYVAQQYNYSGVQVAYEGAGTYEEAFGLDEFNATSTFGAVINKVNQLLLSCKNRWDDYGLEFARRKPKFRFATTDTNYDNLIFGLDLKNDNTGIYKQRKWRDDFSEVPSGVYDPESATNLRMSPVNVIIIRHAWEITAGLLRYPTKFLRYLSSTANSRLKTKLRSDNAYLLDSSATPGNGNAYAENGDIINSELQQPRFISDFIEFDHEVGFELMQKIEGFTTVNGENIFNRYGLFEFTNENGDQEQGFLMSVKINNEGRWKLLKSNT